MTLMDSTNKGTSKEAERRMQHIHIQQICPQYLLNKVLNEIFGSRIKQRNINESTSP